MKIIRHYLSGSFSMHKHSHLSQSKSFQFSTKQKTFWNQQEHWAKMQQEVFDEKWIVFHIYNKILITIQALTWSARREKVVNNHGTQPYIPFPHLYIWQSFLKYPENASILEPPKAVTKRIPSSLYQSQILVQTLWHVRPSLTLALPVKLEYTPTKSVFSGRPGKHITALLMVTKGRLSLEPSQQPDISSQCLSCHERSDDMFLFKHEWFWNRNGNFSKLQVEQIDSVRSIFHFCSREEV